MSKIEVKVSPEATYVFEFKIIIDDATFNFSITSKNAEEAHEKLSRMLKKASEELLTYK